MGESRRPPRATPRPAPATGPQRLPGELRRAPSPQPPSCPFWPLLALRPREGLWSCRPPWGVAQSDAAPRSQGPRPCRAPTHGRGRAEAGGGGPLGATPRGEQGKETGWVSRRDTAEGRAPAMRSSSPEGAGAGSVPATVPPLRSRPPEREPPGPHSRPKRPARAETTMAGHGLPQAGKQGSGAAGGTGDSRTAGKPKGR